MTFEDFMNTGKFGCSNCYDIFESKIDPILKNIHGSNRHVGRLGKVNPKVNLKEQEESTDNIEANTNESEEKEEEVSELDKLKQDLQKAIKEENYEEAARLRDQIKNIEGE